MKRIVLAVLPALALAAFLGLAFAPVGTAHASDKYSALLANADGGSTLFAAASPLVSYSLECLAPSCYSTSSSNQTASDCAHDYILPAMGNAVQSAVWLTIDGGVGTMLINGNTSNNLAQPLVYGRDFDMGADSFVLAKQLDGGTAPGCRLMQNTKNPNSLR